MTESDVRGFPDPLPIVKVPDQIAQEWAIVGHAARHTKLMLDGVLDPAINSPFAVDDEAYPWEKLSSWVRGYLAAAVDHLVLWANLVVPIGAAEGYANANPARPYYTIGRAALECSAQAAWVIKPVASVDRVHRHLRLLFHDLRYFEEALRPVDPGRADAVRGRRDALLDRVDERYSRGSIKNEPKYLEMVKEAGGALSKPGDEMDLIWRSASAAAHGKGWFDDYAADAEIMEEFEPGYSRVTYSPDPAQILRVLKIAGDLTHVAAIRFLQGMGVDPTGAVATATQKLRDQIGSRSDDGFTSDKPSS